MSSNYWDDPKNFMLETQELEANNALQYNTKEMISLLRKQVPYKILHSIRRKIYSNKMHRVQKEFLFVPFNITMSQLSLYEALNKNR